MTISRKIHNARVSLPANTATSIATLMRNGPLHWGLEDDLTTPSLDSIIGSELGFIPEAPVHVGSDANVRNAALGGSTYQGVLVAAGTNYSLADMGQFGIIDPNAIWVFNQSGTGLNLVFQGR